MGWRRIFRSLVFMDCWLSYTLGYTSDVTANDVAVRLKTWPTSSYLTTIDRLCFIPSRFGHHRRVDSHPNQQDWPHRGGDCKNASVSRDGHSREYRHAHWKARDLAPRGAAHVANPNLDIEQTTKPHFVSTTSDTHGSRKFSYSYM